MMSGDSASTASRPASLRRVAGWATSRPCASAISLTGPARSCRPRPLGRSGWVSTPTTLCRDASSAPSAGTANCGVPAKATRNGLAAVIAKPDALTGAGSARGATALLRRNTFLALLIQLLADPVALHVGQVVDKQFALEMVHLVLHAHRYDPVQLPLEHRPGPILRPHPYPGRPLHIIEYAGHGQTALLGLGGAFALEDLRIDEDQRLGAVLRQVKNDQAPVHVHLGGREAYALGFIHGFEHVVDQPPQHRVELLHRPRSGAQTRIRIFHNG